MSLEDAFIIQSNLVQVLDNVNLKLYAGEFAYLIGKTGSGKSSLLKTLYSDLKLKEGRGQVGDFNLRTIENKQVPMLRRKIGMVFDCIGSLASYYTRSFKSLRLSCVFTLRRHLLPCT